MLLAYHTIFTGRAKLLQVIRLHLLVEELRKLPDEKMAL